MANSLPYWRLSGLYFFYFSALGALLPFWSLYLQSLGLTPQAIGSLMALLMLTKLIGPNIWGWLADHGAKRLSLIQLGGGLTVLAFTGVFISNGYWWLMGVMLLFGFFWNAILPLLEAMTFSHLGKDNHRYSQLRVWGSIGFIVSVICAGYFFQYYSIYWLPWIIWLLLLGLWGSTLLIVDVPKHDHLEAKSSLWTVLKQPSVIALLAVCFINQVSHGVYYTFYSIYLQDAGYSLTLIGKLWALGVIAEVLIFVLMHRLQVRFKLRHLFILSIALATVRWLLIGHYVDSLMLLMMAQLLHAASFGLYHATAIQYVHHYFTGRLQGRGQALYSSISFGAGGGVGAYLSGHLWEQIGATATYGLAALICAFAVWLAWRYLH